MASEGGEFWKKVKPQPSAKERKALETAGLITAEKRKEAGKKGSQQSLYVSLSELGWDWAASNLDAPISTRSPAPGPILQAILSKLKAHLTKTNTSLADFICPSVHTDVGPATGHFAACSRGVPSNKRGPLEGARAALPTYTG